MVRALPSVLTAAVIFTFYSSADSQAPISIRNIGSNQEISGYVTVELKSGDLSSYRKVSYCMDGELIRNIYQEPFTVQFDSRDYDNGTHTLSIRALNASGPVHRNDVKVSVRNETPAFNFIIENPRRIVPEDRVIYRHSYIDAPHPVLKKNEKEFYFFHNLGLMMHQREKRGITYCASGPPEDPYRTLEWTSYVPELWDKNGHSTQGVWIMGMYRIGGDELLGFTHNESCFDPSKPCNRDTKAFSLGLGYSGDYGKSWLYLGDIVRHAMYGTDPDNNMGGVPYILVDGYFQIYFQEYAEDGEPYPGVARAPVDEVIEAAREGTSVEWRKYSGGRWNEPGLTGLSDNVTGNLGIDFNMHCKATYIPAIGKYVMLTYKRRSPDIYLLTSDDGLDWEIAEKFVAHRAPDRISYPFFADFYSADCHKVDRDFYIYWTKNHKELWMARVRLDVSG